MHIISIFRGGLKTSNLISLSLKFHPLRQTDKCSVPYGYCLLALAWLGVLPDPNFWPASVVVYAVPSAANKRLAVSQHFPAFLYFFSRHIKWEWKPKEEGQITLPIIHSRCKLVFGSLFPNSLSSSPPFSRLFFSLSLTFFICFLFFSLFMTLLSPPLLSFHFLSHNLICLSFSLIFSFFFFRFLSLFPFAFTFIPFHSLFISLSLTFPSFSFSFSSFSFWLFLSFHTLHLCSHFRSLYFFSLIFSPSLYFFSFVFTLCFISLIFPLFIYFLSSPLTRSLFIFFHLLFLTLFRFCHLLTPSLYFFSLVFSLPLFISFLSFSRSLSLFIFLILSLPLFIYFLSSSLSLFFLSHLLSPSLYLFSLFFSLLLFISFFSSSLSLTFRFLSLSFFIPFSLSIKLLFLSSNS